jgi:release factor glutamine methyltransferase
MKDSFTTIKDALEWGVTRLNAAGIADAEAEFLLTGLLGVKRHELFLHPLRPITPGEGGRFRSFISRRLNREPAQYITGKTGFMGLDFKVTPATLIPRPETEQLVELALKNLKTFTVDDSPVIIDLCTGCGCIAVAIAHKMANCRIYATDISLKTLDVALENARVHGVEGRIEFLSGDLYEPLKALDLAAKVQLILSNPPYVSKEDMAALAPEVGEHEPTSALYGGVDGLEFIRRIIDGSDEFLVPGGLLIMEVGYGQGGDVLKLANGTGSFEEVRMEKDLAGIERVLVAMKGS